MNERHPRARSIAILPQVFPPEVHPTAVMLGQLARFLSDRGWRVTVGAGYPHHPSGLLHPGYRKLAVTTDSVDGIEVRRSWHLTSPSRNAANRTAVFVSQALAMAFSGLRSGPVDLVLVVGPPLVGPVLAGLLASCRGARLVNVIYDVFPDIAIATGKVQNRAIIYGARLAERAQYAMTARTIVLSEGLRRRLVERGVAPSRVAVVPVWLDADEIRPGCRENGWRREQGIGADKCVFLYAGTVGEISGANVVIDAAARLRGRGDILFLFVGEGSAKAEVETRACVLGLSNVRCLPFQPRDRLAEVQATADVGLVTLLPHLGRTSVPSKVLGYMAAGRPVLASVDPDSDTGREIAENRLGLVVPAGDPGALATAAVQLADDPQARARFGENSRRRLEECYARNSVLCRFESVLLSVLGES